MCIAHAFCVPVSVHKLVMAGQIELVFYTEANLAYPLLCYKRLEVCPKIKVLSLESCSKLWTCQFFCLFTMTHQLSPWFERHKFIIVYNKLAMIESFELFVCGSWNLFKFVHHLIAVITRAIDREFVTSANSKKIANFNEFS